MNSIRYLQLVLVNKQSFYWYTTHITILELEMETQRIWDGDLKDFQSCLGGPIVIVQKISYGQFQNHNLVNIKHGS